MRGGLRRPLAAVALLTAFSLVAAGCSSGGTGKESGEILIGVDIELTGSSGAIGEANKNALKLAVDEINQNGVYDGRKIKLLIRDNKSNPQEAAEVAKDLIDGDKVSALIGGSTSPTSLKILEVAEDRQVPVISMGSATEIVTPVDQRKFVFKTPANVDVVAESILSDLKRQGITKVGTLSVDNPYGNSGLSAFTGLADKYGVDILASKKFATETTDMTSQVRDLKDENPQAIVVWAIPPNASNAAKSLNLSNFDGKVYFDAGAGAELFLRQAGDKAEGMLMVHPAILAVSKTAATTPSVLKQKDFYSQYSQKYGTFSGFASYAADALGLIVTAIDKAKSSDPKDIQKALENVSYDGLTGSFNFSTKDHGGVSVDALAVLTVRRGAWVPAL